MADLEIVYRRRFVWLWWIVAIGLLAGLMWVVGTYLQGSQEEIEVETRTRQSSSLTWTGQLPA